jgi:hypothetical protein
VATIAPPFVAAMVFCERAIEDQEGIFTLVRLFDELNLTIPEDMPEPTEEAPLPVQLTLFVALKEYLQEHQEPLTFVALHADGSETILGRMPRLSDPTKMNQNAHITFGLGLSKFEKMWFELRYGDRPLTRIPLSVTLQRSAAVAVGPTGPQAVPQEAGDVALPDQTTDR